LLGAIENEQLGAGGGAAAWFTVKVCPAIARAPLRAPPPLAATLNVAVPGPLPLASEVKVIQDAWLVAVHAHPADVEIVIVVPPPPPALMDWLFGAIENEQPGDGGAAAAA
jgi:hypothetical protein